MGWDPSNAETLCSTGVYQNCKSTLLVLPIHNRVKVAKYQIKAMIEAKVQYIVCLGVQHTSITLQYAGEEHQITIAQDVHDVQVLLEDSGIPFTMLHLPMFLENLLYQTKFGAILRSKSALNRTKLQISPRVYH